jgi:hypothetical protein
MSEVFRSFFSYQVADGSLVHPLDFGRFLAAFLAEILAEHAVPGAQQVLEHIFVALAAGAQQIGAPDEQVARKIARFIRRLAGHPQAAVPQPLHHVVATA